MRKVIYAKHITRDQVRDNPHYLFVFGDNIDRVGFGGQAREMRGEPNTIGIPTKWSPNMMESAFFTDDDFDKVVSTIDAEFEKLRNHNNYIIWPEAGIGTGLAQLDIRAPIIFQYIEDKKTELEFTDEFI